MALPDSLVSTDIEITTVSGVWTEYSFLINVTTAGLATLTFGEVGASQNRGPGLDDVSLYRVPEPSVLVLLGLGLLGLGLQRKVRA